MRKADNQSHFLTSLAKTHKIIEQGKQNLANFTLLSGFIEKLNQTEALYNQFLADPDLYLRSAEVLDMYNQLNADVEAACTDFESTALNKIAAKCEQIRHSYSYTHLKDEQKMAVDAKLNEITIEFVDRDIVSLSANATKFANNYAPGGRFEKAEELIKQYEEANRPSTPSAGEPAAGATPQHRTVSIKRKYTSRGELQHVITHLQEQLNSFGDTDTIEISLID